MLKLLLIFVLIGWAEGECPGEDTSLAPLPITREENLPVCEAPYLDPNCICPSSMFECACHKIGKCGSNQPGCIVWGWMNDGDNNCGDWSDELSDVCPKGRFQCDCFNTTCPGESGCTSPISQCNGYNDCRDWSDELNCTCPADKFECPCYKTKNCTSGWGCISKSWQCDGLNDCGDWSDEVNCTCPADKFECPCYKTKNCTSGWGCISKSRQCDGLNDCEDGSDEVNCTCPADKFECSCYKTKNCTLGWGGGCISKSWQCDGWNHCGDGSDEVTCTCPADEFECSCYKTKNCTSWLGGCISKSEQCNEYNDCGDWSDEVNCTCPADKFECSCYKTNNCTSWLGGCISKSEQCNGYNDCGDWSDEVNCTCPADKFECPCYKTKNCTSGWGCISKSMQCDGGNDCGDWSDEVNCTCPADTFECSCYKTNNCASWLGGCISKSEQCNGYNDCGDWSDEVTCTCPADKFECSCYKTNNCTSWLGGCISKSEQCNRYNDCGDWSDEVTCTCPADKFECSCYKTNNCTSWLGGCISKSEQCNRYNDCGDGSDEVNCTCPADTFECSCHKANNCTSGWGCIFKSQQCDGRNDCGDWSDEVNCTCPADTFECSCHKANNCTSWLGGCISKSEQCDGWNDCGDWSDEFNCTCPADEFECSCYKTKNCTSVWGCISKFLQCDGYNGCGDWSDEVNCTCPEDKFECGCVGLKPCIGKDLNCIDRSLLCDGKPDCIDGSDDTHYTCNCSGTYARCPCNPNNTQCSPDGRCIPFSWINDTYVDCVDGTDEVCIFSNITCPSCHVVAVTCRSEKEARNIIHTTDPYTCKEVVGKTCATDVNNCEVDKVVCTISTCSKSCENLFFCENQQLIAREYFCDGQAINGCKDKSDEVQHGFGFKCSGSSRKGVCVLPQTNAYDSVAQCSDSSDICFLNGQFRCFQCLDRKLIVSSKQVCDGVVDCFDMSDECLCENQTLCRDIRGDCSLNQMHCKDSSTCVDQDKVLCNTSVQCVNQTNTKYCSTETASVQSDCVADDNIFTQENQGNESLCVRAMKLWFRGVGRNHAHQYYPMWCDGSVHDFINVAGERLCLNRFSCFGNGEINMEYQRVCDGRIDCDDKSDEFMELCNNTRYYCRSKGKISIDRNHVCDGIMDCDDVSDESICRCENTRFYCTNEQPLSVEMKLVQNGINDCSDGSDECVNLAGNAFADVNEMIANQVYRGIFWVTGILALGGNSFVFVTTTRDLIKVNKDQNLFINTSVFILNLCVSDLLMGVYLLAIIIQATRYSGSYCLFDKEWRSSSLCSGLGAIAVVSSEASAFTMTAMTTFRLISAYKPFLMRNVSVIKTVIAELSCWMLAILLATVPLLNAASEYFVADVWFPNNFYETDLVSRENMSLLAQKISASQPESWYDVKRTIENAFPRNSIKGEFGYYGETSVCMPRLFATTNEFAWEYSTFLITINFLMFVYMVVAYFLIYKRSNRMKGSRSTDVSSKMQKRITRLILTDFCCWIPICVMGFLSVGGVKMSRDAYVLSACLLLPINSALNPLLYSKALEERLSKMKEWLLSIKPSLPTPRSSSSDLSVGYNPHAEQDGDGGIKIE